MGRSGRHLMLTVAAVTVLAWAAASPAAAAYTKLYNVQNDNVTQKVGIRAVCRDIEVIGTTSADLWVAKSATATANTTSLWTPWTQKQGSTLATYGGISSTAVTFGPSVAGNYLPTGIFLTFGWTTKDKSCQLKSLLWYNTPAGTEMATFATLPANQGTAGGGVGGGGIAFYNYPRALDLTFVITNDLTTLDENPTPTLSYMGAEYGVSPQPLPMAGLERILKSGFESGTRLGAAYSTHMPPGGSVTYSAAGVERDLRSLRDYISKERAADHFTAGQAARLVTLMQAGSSASSSAHRAYTAGDLPGARAAWLRGAQAMQRLIDEVRTMGSASAPPPSGKPGFTVISFLGIVARATPLAGAFQTLATDQSMLVGRRLLSLRRPEWYDGAANPAVDLAVPGLTYVPWPVNLLQPGQFTAVTVPAVASGSALIVRGRDTWRDPGSFSRELDWLEQMDTYEPAFDGVRIEPGYPRLDPGDDSRYQVRMGARVPASDSAWSVARVMAVNLVTLGDGSVREEEGAEMPGAVYSGDPHLFWVPNTGSVPTRYHAYLNVTSGPHQEYGPCTVTFPVAEHTPQH